MKSLDQIVEETKEAANKCKLSTIKVFSLVAECSEDEAEKMLNATAKAFIPNEDSRL